MCAECRKAAFGLECGREVRPDSDMRERIPMPASDFHAAAPDVPLFLSMSGRVSVPSTGLQFKLDFVFLHEGSQFIGAIQEPQPLFVV